MHARDARFLAVAEVLYLEQTLNFESPFKKERISLPPFERERECHRVADPYRIE